MIATPGNAAQRRFRLGPNAAARPQACAHLTTEDELRGGTIVGAQTLDAAYPKLALPRGDSFLWIDQLDGGRARGVIIPDDDHTPSTVVDVRVTFMPDLPARAFSEGRWIFNQDDDDLWYSCGPSRCCYVIGGP